MRNPHKQMKTNLKRALALLAAAALTGLGGVARAQTNFGVTTPGDVHQYFINGTNSGAPVADDTDDSPPLTVTAGQTYTFSVSVSGDHPFGITTNFGVSAVHYINATPTTTTSGTITLVIPATNFPSTLYYQCFIHHFYGVITVEPPVEGAPPANHIISLVVGPTSVTMTSDGTNTTYVLVPQFNSNLVNGIWQDVPVFTNVFASGTNTTSFDRPDAVCGPNVFLRITQRPP